MLPFQVSPRVIGPPPGRGVAVGEGVGVAGTGVPSATMLGLGSILGTGVFVSIGLVAGLAYAWTPVAIVVAALVAACNALSSAQLAAAYPHSGGTYEYGYRLLHPAAGFTAGWTFLCAKSASAATAAGPTVPTSSTGRPMRFFIEMMSGFSIPSILTS